MDNGAGLEVGVELCATLWNSGLSRGKRGASWQSPVGDIPVTFPRSLVICLLPPHCPRQSEELGEEMAGEQTTG